MDETEMRVAALETLLIDLLSLADAKLIGRLETSLRQGLVGQGEPGHGSDEQTIRLAALQLVSDGKLRNVLFTPARGLKDMT